MPYDPNIPLATDNPSQSQGELLENFRQIQTQFGTNLSTGSGGDHVLLTSVSNNGRHNRVTLTNQASSPDSVKQAGVDEIRIYGKTVSGVTMPYYTRDNIPITTTEWPLSPIKAYASGAVLTAVTGTLFDSFNLTLTSVATILNTRVVTLQIINAMRTTTYGVLITSSSTNVGQITYTNTLTNSVQINFTGAPTTPFNFTVTLIET